MMLINSTGHSAAHITTYKISQTEKPTSSKPNYNRCFHQQMACCDLYAQDTYSTLIIE